MEEFVRRLIRDRRDEARRRTRPSEAFRRYFGPDHGVELPPRERRRRRPKPLRGGE